MFKNILVANDGSKHADKALDVAAELASEQDVELAILHVLMHGGVPAGFQRALHNERPGSERNHTDSSVSFCCPGSLDIALSFR